MSLVPHSAGGALRQLRGAPGERLAGWGGAALLGPVPGRALLHSQAVSALLAGGRSRGGGSGDAGRRPKRGEGAAVSPWGRVRALGACSQRELNLLELLEDTLLLSARGLYLLVLLTPVLVAAPGAVWFGWGRRLWLVLLRRSLEFAGPAFIKWGQWAATRPDMFPQDICRELARLHSQAPEHSWKHTRRAIERSLGRTPEQIFDYFEEQPIASGSIAQVHRGTLCAAAARSAGVSPGQVVAVKVRHPGVEEAISRDFALMLATVDYLQFYFPNTDLTTIEESVYQFRGPLFEQTDLELEAQHLCTFRENFRGNRRISFPKPLYPYCTSEVLVESFEPGKSIQEYVDIRRGIPFRKTIPVQGLNVLMQMMLKDNLIHADLHPGNVLVRLEEPSLAARLWDLVWGAPLSSPVPNIVLLDVGMAAEMLQEDRSTLGKLFLGTVELNGPMVGEATLELGGSRGPFRSLASDLPVAGAVSEFSPAEVAEKTAAFQKDVNLLFESLKEFDRTFNRLPPPAECMYDLLEIVRQHHVSIKNEISIVIATTFVLEGWATRMDPDLQIIEIIGEHVRPPWSVAWHKFLLLTGLRKRRDPPPNVDDYD